MNNFKINPTAWTAVILFAVFCAAMARADETDVNSELLARGNAAFRSDAYAGAYRHYNRVFQDTDAQFVLRRAAYYRREQCVDESFIAVERHLLAGQPERAAAYLEEAAPFAALGSVERAQLALWCAKIRRAHPQVAGEACRRLMLRLGAGAGDSAEDMLIRLLADADPFTPFTERSEALCLLSKWAGERGDAPAAAAALQRLRAEPAPHPFWVWRADAGGWADYNYGPARRSDFESILAQAGRPRATVTRSAGWPARITATNLADLAAALEQLRQMPASERDGRIVFVPGGCDLDLRGNFLEIPAGVILAGDRGIDGAAGTILRCSHFDRGAACITLQSRSRVTGFRLLGERDPAILPAQPAAAPASSSTNAAPPGAAAEKSADGTGIGLDWGADHAVIDNCEIAWFGRNGAHTHGQYLRVADCHIHDIACYGVLMSIYARHLLVETSRIDWTWQAIGGGRSLVVGYEIRHSVINDARTAEAAQLEKWSKYFYFGTAMGHHSDLGGLRVHVWGNVFPRVDGRVLGLRTVSPRNGPAEGAFAHNNWFPRPYLAGQPPAVLAELRDILQKRGGKSDGRLLADYAAGADYDPREMEIRLRNQLANLWAWHNFYGGECGEIFVSVWTTPMIRWLMPRVMPPTFRLNNPGSIETILQLKHRPGGETVIPLAWKAQMFPGRGMKELSVEITGPFDEVLPGIGKPGAFRQEIFRETFDAPRAESAGLAEASAAIPGPGFYRLDLCVADAGGRVIRAPAFVYCGQ